MSCRTAEIDGVIAPGGPDFKGKALEVGGPARYVKQFFPGIRGHGP